MRRESFYLVLLKVGNMSKKLSANLIKLTNILSDGEYHDGNTLGDTLSMTRSAVWKAIKKLENFNIEIHSIKGKGYALLEPLILLDSKKIKKQIKHKVELSVLESVGSTNTYLQQFKQSNTIKICIAEQQTQGKGRLGREWFSPFGKNIYMSLLYHFKKDISELSGLSLVMSLAIMKTLRQAGVTEKLSMKWPNDLLYAEKKISGTLIEIQAETNGLCHAYIGVGINVNMMHDMRNEVTQPWTSIQKVINQHTDRNVLSASLINCLLDYLHRFELHGLQHFLEEWKEADCLTNKMIEVKNVRENTKGKVVGINEQGHLLLQLLDGSLHAFSSGDTTILKKIEKIVIPSHSL